MINRKFITQKKRSIFYTIFILITSFALLFVLSNVSTELSQDDVTAIKSLGLDNACSNISSFEEEIACISETQKVLLKEVQHVDNGIPKGQSREPADQLREKKGLCFDRSRFIEKTLDFYGFETRHVHMMYSNHSVPIRYAYGGNSHAVSEVLTDNGWMLVDSNYEFIGLDKDLNIYSAKTLKSKVQEDKNAQKEFNLIIPDFYREDYSVLYGLYSRHGKFYPPYVPVPDINWRQFILYNL